MQSCLEPLVMIYICVVKMSQDTLITKATFEEILEKKLGEKLKPFD